MGDADIVFYAIFLFENGSTESKTDSAKTSPQGIAVQYFEVPTDAVLVNVTVEFGGTVYAWPVTAQALPVIVNPPASLLDFILRYLMMPQMQLLIFLL